MTTMEILLALASGGLIGIVLGLVGGGGSILAVPLLIYVVGVGSTHVAIATAAVAVTANALVGLAGHAHRGTVKWPCAIAFAAAGVVGAAIGAQIGKAVDGRRLLVLFGLLMIGVGLSMLRKPRREADPDVRLSRLTAGVLLPRLMPLGAGVGLAAGFFGIGGGFLIVPALIAATAMPFVAAVGTSLVVISALGLTTATSYALSGYVDWPLTTLLIAGGIGGAGAGILLGRRLAGHKALLGRLFALMVIAVGVYVATGAA
jgi:uncharacterized membrane protein YfcA